MNIKHILLWLLSIATLMLLITIHPVYSSEFLIRSVEENQLSPAIAYNSTADEFLVVWEDYVWQATGTLGIAAQRIGTNGSLIGESFAVVGEWFTSRPITNPHLVYNPTADEYLLVWEYGNSSDDHHIYARRLSSTGAPIGDNHIHVAADTTKFEGSPQVAFNPTDNEYFIVWQESNIPIGYEYCLKKISGQRLSATGSLIGPSISILDEATDQLSPALAFNSAQGHYLVVWEEHASGETNIYGQRKGKTGQHIGAKIAITTHAHEQLAPRVAYNSTRDEFLVAWEDHQGNFGDDRDIMGRIIPATGTPQTGPYLISWEGGDLRFQPDVAYSQATDEYLVTWEHTTYSGSGPYYYVNHTISQRRLTSDGSRVGDEQMVSTQGISPQTHPAIAPSDTSSLIVWEDGRNTTMATDLYGAVIAREMLTGHVYEGNIGDESSPLSNVAIDLYCSNDATQLGSLLGEATTDATGSYSFMVDSVCEYYYIEETDPTGYTSTGASSAGRVINDNWIELTYPLSVSEMSDNTFWDISASPPGDWTNFSPTDWVNSQTVTCTVKVDDTGSGLDVSTAQYAYTTGTSWSAWRPASCTGTDGTTSPQTITASNVPFGKDSTSSKPHQIAFHIANMNGMYSTDCPAFNVFIDTTPPINPTLTSDRDTNTWSEDATITITWSGASDAASGVDRYLYQWSTFPNTVPDGGLSTTATSLSTAIPAEGNNNYFHLTTIDAAGNKTATAVHLGPFYLDTGIPSILSGPTVSSTTSSSATITWQSSEEADSVVNYTSKAGPYTSQRADTSLVTDHSITLTSLTPSATYRLMVASTDASGKRVESGEITFETPPLTDTTNPTVSLIDPGVCRGRVTLSATAFDDTGVECVMFSIDGNTIGIDYTAPYQVLWNTEALANKDYIITATAVDFLGKSAIDDMRKPVANFIDDLAPTVDIQVPTEGGTSWGSEEAILKVKIQDDSDWCDVEVLLDDNPITFCLRYVNPGGGWYAECGMEGSPLALDLSTLSLSEVTFFWDNRDYSDGTHTIEVRATDKSGRTGSDTVQFTIDKSNLPQSWDRPELEIIRHEVTRVGNYLKLSIELYNKGDMAAYNVRLEEGLTGFQPASIENCDSYEIGYDHSVQENVFVINDDYIGADYAEQFIEYTIYLSPVLIYPSPPTPSVANYIDLYYEGRDSEGKPLFYTDSSIRFTMDMGEQYDNALKEADYLMVTNPTMLFDLNTNNNDVNTLLSDMARLAQKRNGVLGYMHIKDGQALKYLIALYDPDAYIPCVYEGTCTPPSNPSCEWSQKLSSKFRDTLGGYLLIVGEQEIVPAWKTSQYDVDVGDCTGNPMVSLSDHPYGEYNSSEPVRIVGRIIGNTAADLSNAINASTEYNTFKRSSALLMSGRGSGVTNFVDCIDDIEDIIENEFTVTKIHWKNYDTVIDRRQAFKNNAKDKDVICFRDHGGPDAWGHDNEVTTGDLASVDLGSTNPFILSLACLTGCYEDHINPPCKDYGNDDYNFAEAFFDRGASVFIGATEVSSRSNNSEAGKWFFNHWDGDEDIGTVFTQLERDKWDNGKDWKYWIWEYNIYGDPKFGKLTTTTDQKEVKRAERQAPTPSLDVNIPDYVVNSRDNIDYVRIPDGDLWLEIGKYQVPFFSVSLDYPQGYRVQDVTLTNRSGLVTDTGLNLPISVMEKGSTDPTPPQGWFPALEKQYEWRLAENPDKTTTLIITIYPFYYDGQSTDVQFYKNYSFAIDYISSHVKLAIVKTDKAAYPQGDPVDIHMGINNTGASQDVVVSTIIKPYGSDTVVDSLPLSTLKSLNGYASFSDQWNSSGVNPGYYTVEVTLKDTTDNVLDTRSHMFRLGISAGEVVSLTALPASFDPGDTIALAMDFKNTGTIPITGTAIIKVKDQSGNTVKEYKHQVANLTATNSISFNDTWDTTTVAGGIYSTIGYVLFDSKSSDVMTITVSSLSDGDVAPLGNRDGIVNVGDALVALRFALGLETPTQQDRGHGDVAPLDAHNKPNPDGIINVGDALVILRKALGIISF